MQAIRRQAQEDLRDDVERARHGPPDQPVGAGLQDWRFVAAQVLQRSAGAA